jgi:hypothetical protein
LWFRIDPENSFHLSSYLENIETCSTKGSIADIDPYLAYLHSFEYVALLLDISWKSLAEDYLNSVFEAAEGPHA